MKSIFLQKNNDGTVVQLLAQDWIAYDDKGNQITVYSKQIIDPTVIDTQIAILQDQQKIIASLIQAVQPPQEVLNLIR